MNILKRLLLISVCLFILLPCFGVFAASDNIYISAKGTVRVEAENFSDNFDPETTDVAFFGNAPRYASFNENEWLEYGIDVAKEGFYVITAYAAIEPGAMGANWEITAGNEKIKVTIPTSASWTDFAPVVFEPIMLTKNADAIRIKSEGKGCHFDYFTIKPFNEEGDGRPKKQTGSFRTHILPAALEAEDFDLGASGSFSSDGKNNGGKYRENEQIDIYGDNDKYYISLNNGEFVNYTFNVEHEGTYKFSLASSSGGKVKAFFDEKPFPLSISLNSGADFPETDGMELYFEKGYHSVKILAEADGITIDYIRFLTSDKDGYPLSYFESEYKEETKAEKVNPVYINIYVSADGDDSADGSIDAPFKTLKRAKEEVRTISPNMTGDIVINIEEGYYSLTEKEIFSEQDSGKNGFNIIYRGIGDEKPVFSGGIELEEREIAENGFWKIKVPEKMDIRNLYINGAPAVRARSKYCYVAKDIYNDPKTSEENDGVVISGTNFLEELSRIDRAELVWSLEWTSQRTPVRDIIREGENVIFLLKQPAFEYGATFSDTSVIQTTKGKRFHIENVPELLDTPGEFYYNDDEGVIYYYPFEHEKLDTAEIFVGKTEGLLELRGKAPENRIENITFDNLSFKHGAWSYATENGFFTVQADQMRDVREGETYGLNMMVLGQIEVNHAENINFINNNFSCLGSSAITMADSVKDCEIKGNVFRDISGGAVTVGTWDHVSIKENSAICENVVISNNLIERTSGEYRGSAAITVYYEKDIKILNNHIRDIPYSAISLGWGWGTRDPQTGWGYMEVAHNRLENVMLSLNDGAHLYTLGPLRGTTIHDNYFVKTAHWRGGLYTDSGSAYLEVYNNVFELAQGYWWHMGLLLTHDKKAYDNYSTTSAHLQNGTNNTITNLMVYEDANWPKPARRIIDAAGVGSEYVKLYEKNTDAERNRSMVRLMTVSRELYESESLSSFIQAEDFINGGEGIGYHKINPIPNNNDYRDDGVCLRYEPQWTSWVIDRNFPGEWMAYDVQIEETGKYYFDLSAAQSWPQDQVMPQITLYIDDELIGTADVPRTETWNEKMEVSPLFEVELSKGSHNVRVEIAGNGFYFDAFRFRKTDTDIDVKYEGNEPGYDEGKLVTEDELLLSWEEEIEEKISFTDISGHWAEDYILKAAELGILKGIGEGKFSPDTCLTHSQAALITMRTLKLPFDEENWESSAMEMNLLIGDKDKFITRDEFAKVFMTGYKLKHKKFKITVEDVPFSDKDSIENMTEVMGMKELGLFMGDEKGYFNPTNNIKRSEAAAVIIRMFTK